MRNKTYLEFTFAKAVFNILHPPIINMQICILKKVDSRFYNLHKIPMYNIGLEISSFIHFTYLVSIYA